MAGVVLMRIDIAPGGGSMQFMLVLYEDPDLIATEEQTRRRCSASGSTR